MAERESPKITEVSWGRLLVEGYTGPFKDVKLYPGGAREWDWNETGTRHEPGIQPADVEELLEKGARKLILSKGMQQRLQVAPETLKMLQQRNIPVHILPTEEAVRLYNQLRESEPVGGLIHSTC